jgi:predicted amidohydrolase
MNSQGDKAANIELAKSLVARAAADRPDLVVLPEYCTVGLLSIPTRDGKPATMQDYASYAPRYIDNRKPEYSKLR